MTHHTNPTDPTAHQPPSNTPTDPWDVIRLQYASDTGGARYDAVDQLLREFDLLHVKETGALLRYDPETGLYREDAERLIRQRLDRTLMAFYSSGEAKEILHRLNLRAEPVTMEDLNAPGYVCLLNGVLDLTDSTEPALKEHSTEYRFTSRLPVEYDDEAESPRWDAFLKEAVRPEDLLKLQEFAGYVLHHWGVPFNRFLTLTGPTQSGKSTWTSVLTSVLGEEHASHETLQRLADDKHATTQLVDKHLNTCMDLDRVSPRGLGRLKQLTTGDGVTVEPKYVTPYSTRLYAKHVFGANDLPNLPMDDEAFFERALLVSFPRTVPREDRDPDLADKLREEAPGILNWMLTGYARLMEQGAFTGERSVEEKEAHWYAHGGSVSQFIVSGYVERGADKEAPKEALYEAYKWYCEAEGLPRETYNTFCKRLNEEPGVGTSKPTVDGRQLPHFTGLTISGVSGVNRKSRDGESEELERVFGNTPDTSDMEAGR